MSDNTPIDIKRLIDELTKIDTQMETYIKRREEIVIQLKKIRDAVNSTVIKLSPIEKLLGEQGK